ncbi:hypothetical protein SAMD00019534_009340 [Acytostelium subglobosum LB1]|uniref:hypothetical protein n=1 Tax=Acytostelium subglobosum LB1 TaxID=1410327 RepID=UPI0006448A12|nr:hypothetical protein SAMD00019534_009340 [Acytostelium subglobosum LB1]GAM17759.1 hypothetical protein SAMD00019534_009340 [Acytostelium subglobosum LB1]|eukprot:XP_012758355.1 hypothetical protein SAMD00019534_009340 [Acytostelium subglobosum LB1]
MMLSRSYNYIQRCASSTISRSSISTTASSSTSTTSLSLLLRHHYNTRPSISPSLSITNGVPLLSFSTSTSITQTSSHRSFIGQQQRRSYGSSPLDNIKDEGININVIKPTDTKPYAPRLPPYETSATLDFLITPNQKEFSSQELDKFSNLARAMTSIGYEHQSSEHWKESLESYNKALLYIRNIFGSRAQYTGYSLREYAALMINLAESHSRLDQMDDALNRSRQAVDLLEVDWRDTVMAAPNVERDALRRQWVKDEMLGIAYSNHAEYLAFHGKYHEAEPFARSAHKILGLLFPLDHPVNVDLGILLVQVLNETGRSQELDRVSDLYGDILTNAIGTTENMQATYDKLDEQLVDKVLESVKQRYPGFLEAEEAKFLEEEKNNPDADEDEDEDEDDEAAHEQELINQKIYGEPDFGVHDLLYASNVDTRSALTRKGASLDDGEDTGTEPATQDQPDLEEESIDQLLMEHEDIEDHELEKYGDEDQAEERELDQQLGFKVRLDPEESQLNKIYEMKLGGFLNLPEEGTGAEPLNRLVNNMDRILTEGEEVSSRLEFERMVDRDRRIKNRPSQVVDEVRWDEGEITTPTEEDGEPISQAAMDKMGRYLSEEFSQHDMEEENEAMDQQMEKMMRMIENMTPEEERQLDEEFKAIGPVMHGLFGSDSGDVDPSKFFNTSLKELEREERQRLEKEENKENDDDDDDDYSYLNNNNNNKSLDFNPEMVRQMMKQAEKFNFNPDEMAKHIKLDQFGLGKMDGGPQDGKAEAENEDDLWDGMNFGNEQDGGNEDIDLDAYIKQATQSQDFKQFFEKEESKTSGSSTTAKPAVPTNTKSTSKSKSTTNLSRK